MPSRTQTMVAPGLVTVFAPEKRNSKIKPSLIAVDNVLGVGNAILTIQDRFTPAITNGVAAPVATTATRLQINVSIGACVTLRDELKDVVILGQLEMTIAVADINCVVTVAWEYN